MRHPTVLLIAFFIHLRGRRILKSCAKFCNPAYYATLRNAAGPSLVPPFGEQVSQSTSNLAFDELAKGLATGTLSRGKAIRLVGGALLGAALASFPGVAWADGCRRLGRECRRDHQCCSKNCVRRGDDKVCACPEGQRRCNDRCVNLKRNENHCGSCSNRCAEGQECVGGVCSGGEPICTPSCPSGCECGDRADGTGTVCTDCTTGCDLVTSCEQCSPGTICVVEVPGNPPTGFLCGNPCQSCAQNGSICMSKD
jgi:hypothetical protein